MHASDSEYLPSNVNHGCKPHIINGIHMRHILQVLCLVHVECYVLLHVQALKNTCNIWTHYSVWTNMQHLRTLVSMHQLQILFDIVQSFLFFVRNVLVFVYSVWSVRSAHADHAHVSMCVCICIYIYMHTHIYIHIHIHILIVHTKYILHILCIDYGSLKTGPYMHNMHIRMHTYLYTHIKMLWDIQQVLLNGMPLLQWVLFNLSIVGVQYSSSLSIGTKLTEPRSAIPWSPIRTSP